MKIVVHWLSEGDTHSSPKSLRNDLLKGHKSVEHNLKTTFSARGAHTGAGLESTLGLFQTADAQAPPLMILIQ